MPQVLKRRRVSNPGRRKKMTAKQIRFFGTKRQRAALKNASKRKRKNPSLRKVVRKVKRQAVGVLKSHRRRKRVSNIGEILTVSLPGLNPGRKRRKTRKVSKKRSVPNMARKRVRRRKNAGTRVGRSWSIYKSRRRRANPHRRRRRHNPAKVVYRYRRHNAVGRRRHGRRNPGMMSGAFGTVAGIIGGATITSLIVGRLPVALGSGFAGYLSTAVVAMVQGQLIGKVLKNSKFGRDMTIGGFTALALKLVNDFVPGLGLGFGLSGRGMGIITPSSFYVPQVNQPGSMASFVTPAGIPVAAPSNGMGGMGRAMARRVGRMA